MNLSQVGRSLPLLVSQVQQFVFDYNLERAINSEQDSAVYGAVAADEHEQNWNFPGLRRKNRATTLPTNLSKSQQGINELLLFQQRTVLQVRRILEASIGWFCNVYMPL